VSETDQIPVVEGQLRGPPAMIAAVASLIRQAEREVRLYAPYLEPAIFNNSAVTSALSAFAARRSRQRVMLLVQDASATVRENSRLVGVALRLSDSIEFRCMGEDDRGAQDLFLVVDHTKFLSLEDATRASGVVDLQSPYEATKLMDRFDTAWDRGESIALRSLGL
jgi:hypothetical protein